MKILALEKELAGKTAEDFQPYLEEEARRVWDLYKSGVILEIYFREDQDSAVLMLECDNLAEAEGKLASLPLVREKLICFDLMPLIPYPGFERLFK